MDDVGKPQTPGEEPVRSQQSFRFAGVELKPDDDPNDKIRERARRELLVNLIGSIMAGTVLLFVGGQLSGAGLLDLPSPYPFSGRGLLIFYIGWAMYWGIRCVIRDIYPDELLFLQGFPAVFAVFVLVLYSLLGGGIYLFYKLVRQGMGDLAGYELSMPESTSEWAFTIIEKFGPREKGELKERVYDRPGLVKLFLV